MTDTSGTGAGPWAWACEGSGLGGADVLCETGTASTDGVCGSAASTYTNTAPTTNLCAAGTPSSVEGDGSPWTWNCYGSGPGSTDVLCSASSAAIDGVCGSAAGVTTATAPTANLCASGTVVTPQNDGTVWGWVCMGSDDTTPLGNTVSCTAPLPVPGQCGAANGGTTNAAPSGSNLCATGTASAVSGSGPWTWTCQGTGGDPNASCEANPPDDGGGPPITANAPCPSDEPVCFTADDAVNTDGAPADSITSLDFPFPIMVGAMSEPERAVFFNTSGADITISSIAYGGANGGDFSTATTNCTGALANGHFCYIWANFTPGTPGAESATLTVSYTGGTVSLPLSGTGASSGSVVHVSGCNLPGTLAANTTYVMGDVTCNFGALHTSNGSVLQGDCTKPYGDGTVFSSNGSSNIFMDTLSDGTTGGMIRCIEATGYGPPNAAAPDSTINVNTGWVVANSSVTENGRGFYVVGGGELYDSYTAKNTFNGDGYASGTGNGTINVVGDEYYHNSTSSSCTINGDCGAFKADGGDGTLVFDGIYSHNDAQGVGAWCDDSCGHFTVENSTISDNPADGIRCEVDLGSNNDCIVEHNVIINESDAPGVAQADIIATCSPNFTADYNYEHVLNAGSSPGDMLQGPGNRTGCAGRTFNYEASHNIIVIPSTSGGWGSGWRVGLGSTDGTSGVKGDFNSDYNTYYAPSGQTGASFFRDSPSSTSNVNFADWQAAGLDAHGSIVAGTPAQPPSGCTGDGTYGIGCRGSGM